MQDCEPKFNTRDLQTGNAHDRSGHETHALRTLFPILSEGQLSDVAEVLDGYCEIAWRIYERLEREQPEAIDELMRNRRMRLKVDSSKQT